MMIKNKGIGLLELMLALAIISVLLVAATRYFSSTNSSQKVNAAANILQAVINASEDYKMSHNDKYTDISLSNIASLLPSDFSTTSGNPWGGGVDVNPKDGDNSTIVLTLSGIAPAVDCTALIDLMSKKGIVSGACADDSGKKKYTGNYSS